MSLQIPAPSTSILVDIIPFRFRKIVYSLFGLVGLVIAVIVTVFLLPALGNSEEDVPAWLVIIVTVYMYLTPFFSALATSNAVPTGGEAIALASSQDPNSEDDSSNS